MRYQSNLKAPDLRSHFKLLRPPKQICGHDAPSDPDFEPNCTFWTDDEAAILYNVAAAHTGEWVDIGARLGWTAAHLAKAGNDVFAVDPELGVCAFRQRFTENLYGVSNVNPVGLESYSFFKFRAGYYDGFVIDGNHDSPEPLNDARMCHFHAKDDAVILFHDFWGKPIRDGVNWLIDQGWKCRTYGTPNGVACCWRGDFTPPCHQPDPKINWNSFIKVAMADFDFERYWSTVEECEP